MRYKWTEIPIPTRIKNMVIKMACLFPAGCEITDGWVKKSLTRTPQIIKVVTLAATTPLPMISLTLLILHLTHPTTLYPTMTPPPS